LELADFERHLTAFIRAFGLLSGDVTPCGEPVPVSEAHAVTELANAGPLAQRDLGDRLQLTKGTVSRIVRLLAERGWVRQIREGGGVEVRLTASGRAAAKRIARRRQDRLAAMLDAVPGPERQRVVDALALLAKAAHEQSNHP
jgi:DNA-binding MarR family transcriptional regulator